MSVDTVMLIDSSNTEVGSCKGTPLSERQEWGCALPWMKSWESGVAARMAGQGPIWQRTRTLNEVNRVSPLASRSQASLWWWEEFRVKAGVQVIRSGLGSVMCMAGTKTHRKTEVYDPSWAKRNQDSALFPTVWLKLRAVPYHYWLRSLLLNIFWKKYPLSLTLKFNGLGPS